MIGEEVLFGGTQYSISVFAHCLCICNSLHLDLIAYAFKKYRDDPMIRDWPHIVDNQYPRKGQKTPCATAKPGGSSKKFMAILSGQGAHQALALSQQSCGATLLPRGFSHRHCITCDLYGPGTHPLAAVSVPPQQSSGPLSAPWSSPFPHEPSSAFSNVGQSDGGFPS